MRIGIIKPANTGHDSRGIGTYIRNLLHALKNIFPNEILEASANKLPENCDLYHFPYFDPFFLTLPFIRFKPTVITIHDLIPIRFPKYFLRGIKGGFKWQIQKYLAKNTNAIITDSYASKIDIHKYMGINENKIYPIHLAAENIFFQKLNNSEEQNLRKKYSLPKQFALYVGDVNWNKNLLNIVKAIKIVNFPLVIVSRGFNEDIADSENPWLAELNLVKKEIQGISLFHLLNNISAAELPILYKISEMLLYPSRYEGFGLPVLEAFASKCPVVTSDRGSLKEIIADAAFIVDPESPAQISQTIKRLLTDAQLTSTMINKGYIQSQKFSWENTAKQTYSVYTQILSES